MKHHARAIREMRAELRSDSTEECRVGPAIDCQTKRRRATLGEGVIGNIDRMAVDEWLNVEDIAHWDRVPSAQVRANLPLSWPGIGRFSVVRDRNGSGAAIPTIGAI